MGEALRKETISAAQFNGLGRRSKTPFYGERYDHTPIKQQLPTIGSTIMVKERVYDLAGRLSLKDVDFDNYVYTVKSYSQGINNPLKNNNFMLCSYVSKHGDVFSKSFRVLDVTIGILEITYLEE